MADGQSFEMFLGGCAESVYSHPGRNVAYVTPRTGIFKYAIDFGYTLQPRWTFGDTDLYDTPSFWDEWQAKVADKYVASLPLAAFKCGAHTFVDVIPKYFGPPALSLSLFSV